MYFHRVPIVRAASQLLIRCGLWSARRRGAERMLGLVSEHRNRLWTCLRPSRV